MGMLGTIYISTSGLTAYSNGLNNLSSNIANLNTPGYKRTDLQFRDFAYEQRLASANSQSYTNNQMGRGVVAEQTSINFAQGEVRATGNDTDIAIDGGGFFILRDTQQQEVFYTRIGQFEFDTNGYLVSADSGLRVAALNQGGQLADINISDLRAQDPQVTSSVSFIGNLSSGADSHSINDIEVFDAGGGSHELDITLTNNSVNLDRSWLVQVRDENGDVVLQDAEIRFNANASPATDFNSVLVTLSGDDFDEFTIELNFGEADSFSQVTNFSTGTNSSMAFDRQDGYAPGILSELSINSNGFIDVTYSNEQSQSVVQIAVANFENPQQLTRFANGLFLAQDDMRINLGVAGELGNGSMVAGSIELSNVELTEQFSDMIVIQRGYQASSQLLTVTNEMMQQILEATKTS